MGCLTDSGQSDAWDCDIIGPPIQFNVQAIAGTPQGGLTVALENIDIMNVTYGMQPPVMTAQKMILVSDLDEPARGPAWHFQALYDKVVLIGTDKLAAASSIPEAISEAELARRDASVSSIPNIDRFQHHYEVEIGARPWMCFWNQTFIEGFIYVQQDSDEAKSQASESAASVAMTATTTAPSVFSTSYPTGTSSVASTFTSAFQTPSYPSVWPTYTSSIDIQRRDRDYDDDDTASQKSQLPIFPYVVKVEERRAPIGATAPYCQLMQLLNSGELAPVPNDEGSPIIVPLAENDPSPADFSSAFPSGSADKRRRQTGLNRRDDPAGSCHCQWMSS